MARNISARGEQRGRLTRSPQALATRLADLARRLHTLALRDLSHPQSTQLIALYQQARRELAPDLSEDDFADVLAQMTVYCWLLISSWTQEQPSTTLANALDAFLTLPGLPPFVSRLLTTLWHSSQNERDELANCVRDLLTLLGSTNTRTILRKLPGSSDQNDTLIYFYETFLAAYAPSQRSQRGVYYTPAPVIAYMVRAIDELLRDTFAYAGGLAEALQESQRDRGVFLYDPACGTGAFLREIIDYVRHAYAHPGKSTLSLAGPSRLSGYEVMPVAYLLACIELAVRGTVLTGANRPEKGSWFPGEERFGRKPDPALSPIEGTRPGALARLSLINVLAEESLLTSPAAALPVVLGNPPYAGHSRNHSDWLGQLLKSYKVGDASLKKPAQTKWLSDDYVQFLRLAQWQVEQAGQGIVAFLTSHSYLDNPTFRAMRLSLLRSFDEIYILDLHGNSKRRELTPGGTRDDNIFMIQQGIAIGIFVKRATFSDTQAFESEPTWKMRPAAEDAPREEYLSSINRRELDVVEPCSPPNGGSQPGAGLANGSEHLAIVHYADLWGARAIYTTGEDGSQRLGGGKLGWLASHSLHNTPWRTSHPEAPFYLFTPRCERFQEEYMLGWSLPTIFALNGDPAPGLVTCQDAFAISWDAAEATAKIAELLATRSEEEARKLFRLCKQKQWNYSAALRELGKDTWRAALDRIHYRPFDTRWTVFERHVAVHLRERVTRHMRAGPNLALAVGRAGQVIDGGDNWDIAFCSRLPTEFNLYRRGGNYLFPLYLYTSPGATRSANLAPAFCAEISRLLALRWLPDGRGDLNSTFGPEDVFAYIYALLYAPGYRTRYADFLKIDFPRIPLPRNADLFRQLCLSGHALARAHLLEQPLSTSLAWSSSPDHNLVTQVSYFPHEHGGCISINPQQYLSHVPVDAWTLTIGGHQVARKWLLDRQGRRLSAGDLTCYSQIIASLIRTRELMAHIDALIEQYSGWPL